MPIVYFLYDKMVVGDTTEIFFKNLDALDATSIEDFDVSFAKGDIFAYNDGKLTAQKIGEETVTITLKRDNRITTTAKISVVDLDNAVIIRGRDETGVAKVGEEFQISYLTNLNDDNFVWSAYPNDNAIVDDRGYVVILNEGYVTITVYDQNNSSKYIANYYLYVEGEVEVDYVSRFIHRALRENGYKETGININKFGAWYPNNGQPWCAMFVSWCWYFSGLSNDLLLKYQGCYIGIKWCTEQGIMHFVQNYTFGEDLNGASRYQYAENYKPQTGDIIFFLSSGMSHTGIAIYADDTYLYTIEGNTSDSVAIKRWSLNDARITGYASPKYPEYSKPREDFSWIADQKADGTYWWTKVNEQQKVD